MAMFDKMDLINVPSLSLMKELTWYFSMILQAS